MAVFSEDQAREALRKSGGNLMHAMSLLEGHTQKHPPVLSGNCGGKSKTIPVVLKCIEEHGPIMRVDIRKKTGLSKSHVEYCVCQLVASGKIKSEPHMMNRVRYTAVQGATNDKHLRDQHDAQQGI